LHTCILQHGPASISSILIHIVIATLTGKVAEKLAGIVIVDVGGVGYGLLMPLEDLTKLDTGDTAKIYVYEHIRENAHDLYGFVHLDTKRLFEQLIDVNGVGPKMALSILGTGSVEDVRQAIAGGDTKFISTAQGVGKRVAERVVVDLKDKVGLVSTASEDALFLGGQAAGSDEAVQGLVALGYSMADAVAALSGIDNKLPTEARIKQALKGRS
jgi:holliday junction DNA helicase RuvA